MTYQPKTGAHKAQGPASRTRWAGMTEYQLRNPVFGVS